MRRPYISGFGLQAAAIVATLAGSSSAHSWIEMAYRIASNGTMIGTPGYPRGYVPRNSTDPVFSDTIPVWLLPPAGQSAYSGDEVLNKFPQQQDPAFPLLEASPGDYIALLHLENGHTTLPQNQPKKPQNRGTLFFYGTSHPRAHERLFDVHLAWNRDGTGGDARGRLLGTRNYDDGQCYQPNDGQLSIQRAAALQPDGALHSQELACQSDLRLPDDLAPGSTYTIYWYWDWPDLDPDNIDFAGTTDGIFPWAGTFMRGERDPHGFSMAAIAKNESYASTIDIKITAGGGGGGGGGSNNGQAMHNNKHINVASDWVEEQNIYSKAIREQLENNYQVDLDAISGPSTSTFTPTTTTSASVTTTTTSASPAITSPSPSPSTSPHNHDHDHGHDHDQDDDHDNDHTRTVTAFVTVWPSTTWQTLTRTAPTSYVTTDTTTEGDVVGPTPTDEPTSTVLLEQMPAPTPQVLKREHPLDPVRR